MPEWYFVLVVLGVLTALGASWLPLLWLSPVLLAGTSLTLLQAFCSADRARFHPEPRSTLRRVGLQLLVVSLHLFQPAARLLGRVQHGLGPWRFKGFARVTPLPIIRSFWSERWQSIESRLSEIKTILEQSGAVVVTGGDFDSWDIAVRGGLFGSIRVRAMVEEHGDGRQLYRFRSWPTFPAAGLVVLLAFLTLAILAALDRAWVAGISLGLAAGVIALLIYTDCTLAMRDWWDAVDGHVRRSPMNRLM